MVKPWAPRLVPALALLAALSGCEGGLELAVDLRTDLVPGQEFDTIRVAAEGQRRMEIPVSFSRDGFARPRRIAELSGLRAGRRTVEVELLRNGSLVLARRVAVRFDASLVVLVVMTRDCREVSCPGAGDPPGATECLGGRCVDPSCSTADPGACGAARCADDSACASEVACAEARCVAGVCLQLGGEGACEAGEYCQPERGCLPLDPEGFDAGAPDAEILDATFDARPDGWTRPTVTAGSRCDFDEVENVCEPTTYCTCANMRGCEPGVEARCARPAEIDCGRPIDLTNRFLASTRFSVTTDGTTAPDLTRNSCGGGEAAPDVVYVIRNTTGVRYQLLIDGTAFEYWHSCNPGMRYGSCTGRWIMTLEESGPASVMWLLVEGRGPQTVTITRLSE